MHISFCKYQGTGNDFIMIDNRNRSLQLSTEQVNFLCSRGFGIGADGLILLESEPGADFKMVYYNSDGKLSSMCGNGGRCIVSFAARLGLVQDKARFLASDGLHEARLLENSQVSLKMIDVKSIERGPDFYFLDTGSPHVVQFTSGVHELDVVQKGRSIRNSARFAAEGTNVNFIEQEGDAVFVRTYERGVENETLSCGTGVTAAALVAALEGRSSAKNACDILTRGGRLNVSFERVLEQNFYNIWLTGPAQYVFQGEIDIPEQS